MEQSPRSEPATFNCPACGKVFRWKAELAGRKVRCVCGRELAVAAQPPDSPVPPTSADPPPKLGGLLAEAMSRAPSIVEEALANREDEVQPSILKDRYAPIALAAIGLAGTFAFWIILGRSGGLSLTGQLLSAFLIEMSQVLIYLPLGVYSAFFIARLMGTTFDDVPTTAIKLGGILMGAGALADCAFLGALIQSEFDEFRVFFTGFALYMIPFALLLWWLFSTDMQETMIFVLLLTLPRMLMVFTLFPLAMMLVKAV